MATSARPLAIGPVNAACRTFTAFSQGEFPAAWAKVLRARKRAALSPNAAVRTYGLNDWHCIARSLFIPSSGSSLIRTGDGTSREAETSSAASIRPIRCLSEGIDGGYKAGGKSQKHEGPQLSRRGPRKELAYAACCSDFNSMASRMREAVACTYTFTGSLVLQAHPCVCKKRQKRKGACRHRRQAPLGERSVRRELLRRSRRPVQRHPR